MRISYQVVAISTVSVMVALLPVVYVLELSIVNALSLLAMASLLSATVAYWFTRRIRHGFIALDVGLQNFKDGEFSSSLAYQGSDELSDLCALYNETAEQLRREKHWLYQRELMLDKVLQSSPDVLFLVNDQGIVVFSNWSARTFFNKTSRLEGFTMNTLLNELPDPVQAMLQNGKEGLFSIVDNNAEHEIWHCATGAFLLNNQQHQLFILKQMTRELSRQEAQVWKKVIRIISHELNNSLGPISSMLHSGQILAAKIEEPRLGRVFNTIQERINHLNQFVQDYGKFAKLPVPHLSLINWSYLVEQLHQQWQFNVDIEEGVALYADEIQLEQMLINLLKNAHESESVIEAISLTVKAINDTVVIEVNDKGKGMSPNVMASALIPFYSTKPTGSGLGLALCREIADAHNGHIGLMNREEGGLCVRVNLPKQSFVQ